MTEKEINAIYYKLYKMQKEIEKLKETRINDLENIANYTIKLENKIKNLEEE